MSPVDDGPKPTLETPCLSTGNWLRRPSDSTTVHHRDFCSQCFPDGEQSVDEFDVGVFLVTSRTGSKLHRSVDTGAEADRSMFQTSEYPEQTLCQRLQSDDVELDYQFDWDTKQTDSLADGGESA